jgi:hypothetical protein
MTQGSLTASVSTGSGPSAPPLRESSTVAGSRHHPPPMAPDSCAAPSDGGTLSQQDREASDSRSDAYPTLSVGPSPTRNRDRRRNRRSCRNSRRGPHALRPARRRCGVTHRTRHGPQNETESGVAIGYNSVALPITAGVFEAPCGLVLRPEIAAITMAGSSFLVAVNALTLKRLRLPAPESASADVEPAAGGIVASERRTG